MLYRKRHLLFIKSHVQSQKSQKSQKKTFDALYLVHNNVRAIQFEEYEALRRILSRKLLRLLRFMLFRRPYGMVTAKPREMRMGKGKGSLSHFSLPAKNGMSFVKIFWCHNSVLALFFYVTRNALKKSAQRFTF